MVVDEFLPCKIRYGEPRPVFAEPLGEEIWVALLERLGTTSRRSKGKGEDYFGRCKDLLVMGYCENIKIYIIYNLYNTYIYMCVCIVSFIFI